MQHELDRLTLARAECGKAEPLPERRQQVGSGGISQGHAFEPLNRVKVELSGARGVQSPDQMFTGTDPVLAVVGPRGHSINLSGIGWIGSIAPRVSDGAEWKLRRRRVSPYDDSGGGKQPERAQLLVGIQLASVCRGGRPAATGRQSQGPRKMNTRIRSYTAVIAVFALGGTGLTGCASLSQTERGAVIGGAGGAAGGACVGRQIGSGARGAGCVAVGGGGVG